MTGNAIRFVLGIPGFNLFPGMYTLFVLFYDGFMIKKLASCWILDGVTFRITLHACLDLTMGELLYIIMTISTFNVAMYSVSIDLRYYVIAAASA
jgi:hypothetical protein